MALRWRGTLPKRPYYRLSSAGFSTSKSTSVADAVLAGGAKEEEDKVYTATYNRSSKPSVVVLGSGWGGFQVARDLDKSKFDVTVISQQNHFLFTPLLPSTTVGTLEFRCIQEPVRTIPGVRYYQAVAQRIDFQDKAVVCQEVFLSDSFRLPYDHLVIAVGARTNTFNTPGVSQENQVYFLKTLSEARAIRSRIIECFERASYPGLTSAEQSRLLSFVVVGGGPTSVEFTSELHDFLRDDVHAWYPDLEPLVSVTLVEASSHILGAFDQRLVTYVSGVLKDRKVEVLTGVSVTKVEQGAAFLKDGRVLHFGLCVWATGVRAVPLIRDLKPNDTAPIKKGRGDRLVVDSRLRVSGLPPEAGVFALGDCAVSESKPLPALAQVAQQQAKYLAKAFNNYYHSTAAAAASTSGSAPPPQDVPEFEYRHLGSMAQLGMWKGAVDTGKVTQEGQKAQGPVLEGLLAFLVWRSAYWTKSVSIANKMLIPAFWLKSWLFGRDISRF